MRFQQPRQPPKADCWFYHCMTYPDGESVEGPWDIRGRFDEYIGHYPLAGKTVLDIGTATGFLAFSAEAAGANVTALDAASAAEFKWLPVKGALHYEDRAAFRLSWEQRHLAKLSNSWWYGWHKFDSKAKLVHAPITDLYDWEARFDVVIAGALIEHLSDPVSAIGAMTKVASEAVVLPYTEVVDTDELLMQPVMAMVPEYPQFLWKLSRGMYRQLFGNLGFAVEFTKASAITVADGIAYERPTINARRI